MRQMGKNMKVDTSATTDLESERLHGLMAADGRDSGCSLVSYTIVLWSCYTALLELQNTSRN